MAEEKPGIIGGICNKASTHCLYLTCKVPDVLRKDSVRSREVLELARTMSKRDW